MWKNKVLYQAMLDFCVVFRDRSEVRKKFDLTDTESRHCFNWFSKFKDDFIVEEKRGVTGKAIWLKAR